jgi:hypothetical protein
VLYVVGVSKYFTGEKKSACRVMVGKPEEKSSLKRSGRTWEGNTEVDLNP